MQARPSSRPVFLLAVFLSQSLPLRHHQEHGGSFEAVQRDRRRRRRPPGGVPLAAGQGAVRGQLPFGGPVWLHQGQVAPCSRERPDAAYVQSFVRGFPGQPVFLVSGRQAPRDYAGLGLRLADRITYAMPVWEETYVTRPSKAVGVPSAILHLAGRWHLQRRRHRRPA